MRAIVVHKQGGPEVLTLEDIPDPEPGPGQALIRVAYAALNPLDILARGGKVDWGVPPLPFVPGYEYAGRIEAVGDGVDTALIGRRVASAGEWGGNGEFAVATAAQLVPVPDAFDWRLGACFFTCAYTAWHLIHTAGRVAPGQVVVVHSGAGALGVMTTQVAKSAGATVISFVGGPEKIAWAKEFGADHFVDYRAQDFDAEVMRLTGGGGADLIIDGVQGPDAPKNLGCLKHFGRVIYMGAVGGLAPEVNISELIGKSAGVSGFVLYHAMALTKGAEAAEIEAALSSGTWRMPMNDPVPLEQVPDLHRAFEARELKGRSLIRVGGEI